MPHLCLVVFMLPVGACIGSFLGVLVYRLPRGINACEGRSQCEACGTPLAVPDLVPLLSFLWLGGSCRYCGTRIRRELFTMELAAAFAAAFCAWVFPAPLPLLFAALLAWGLLALAWIDARYFFLPDSITLSLIPIGLAATWWISQDGLTSHVIGAALGYLGILAINTLYKVARHRDGIGRGDAKLLALAGAWTGWQALPWIIFVAAVIGIAVALVMRLTGRNALNANMRLPFGSCLAPAIFAAYVLNEANLIPAFG